MAKPECTVDKLDKAVENLAYEWETKGKLPTEYVLFRLTGLTEQTLERWYDGKFEDGESKQYQAVVQKLVALRRHICTLSLASGSRGPQSNMIFLSKQKMWGGFSDSIQKVENTGKQELVVKLAGPDGKAIKRGR